MDPRCVLRADSRVLHGIDNDARQRTRPQPEGVRLGAGPLGKGIVPRVVVEDPRGTTRLDAYSGPVLYVVTTDRVGTGEFLGDILGPNPTLAWS